ncbi:flippase [Celerinatantimonas sp. YJH-8]|uniref:flippase n=1 Tax=Celerinatantimonas sp. YJH-8 TaxID=3228714 RepID=UPI0038CB116C
MVKDNLIQKIFFQYLTNTSWMMVEQILRIISGLFIGVWVARYLGPEEFGLLSYAIAFSAIFGGIAKLGLDSIIVREIVNKPHMKEAYLGTAFWLKLTGAIGVICLIVAILPFLENNTYTNVLILIVSTSYLLQCFEVVDFYFQSQVRIKLVSICKIIQLLLSSVIKIYLIKSHSSLILFVSVVVFDSFSLAICYACAYIWSEKINFYKRFDFSIARSLINDSWPLILSAMVVMMYMRIDQIIINKILNSYQLGLYSGAIRLIEILYIPASITIKSLSPYFLRKNINNEYFAYAVLSQIIFIIGVVLAAISVCCSHFFYLKIFGISYVKSSEYFNWLTISLLFFYLSVPFSSYFVKYGLLKFQLFITVVSLIINIVLDLFLIPKYGVKGAIFSTIIARACTSLSIYMVDKKLFFVQLKSCLFLNLGKVNKL